MKSNLEEKIREDYRKGLSTRELAKKYRMSLRDIGKILRNEGYTVISKKELNELRKKAEIADALIEIMKLRSNNKEIPHELTRKLRGMIHELAEFKTQKEHSKKQNITQT